MATVIKALEELYPLQAEHTHLDLRSRWQQVIDKSNSRVRIQSDNMEQVRLDTIFEWGGGASTIGPIPRNLNKRVLTSLSQSFTHRDNPHGNSNPNKAFQRDLDEFFEADAEYNDSPTLSRLCSIVAELAFRWEKLETQGRRMSGSSSSCPSTDKGKHSSSNRGKSQAPDKDDLHFDGCNRTGHLRETCNIWKHPDFNHSGQWEGCRADSPIRQEPGGQAQLETES